MLRRIARDQVQLGMFIHAFDGPWLRHPFWQRRFLLTQDSDLARIRDSDLSGIVIDEDRGLPLAAAALPADVARDGLSVSVPPMGTLSALHASSFAAERVQALTLVKDCTHAMKAIFADVHGGGPIELEAFAPIVGEIMASVSRNPHALIAITRLRQRDEDTYVHLMAVSALMVAFARGQGMSDAEVFEMGLAGLLHDIGKMAVPDDILKKPGSLTVAQIAIMRTHPDQGCRLLGRNSSMPAVVLDVCRHHHERVDGSGYPFGLKGDAISRASRIAAICDVYDALTSNRTYKDAWTPEAAISRMAEWSGHFDRALLFAFMKTIGVYPPGLLVRLRSNRLGITMANGRGASRPKVRAFYCVREGVQTPLEDVVIDDTLAQDQVISEEYPLDWGIADWPHVAELLTSGQTPHLITAARRHSA